jgi:hypothetical protein
MISFYKIFLFTILFLAISCSRGGSKNPNQAFLEQHGGGLSDVKRRIKDNDANAKKVLFDQHNTRTSLDIKQFRYGSYDRNARIYFPIYLGYNFPESYPVSRVNFSDIKIPSVDQFDVSTEMRKSYPIIDRNNLQRNIRTIEDNASSDK